VQGEPGREIQYWHLTDLDWPVADRRVQVVKTVRLEQQRRVTVREKEGHRSMVARSGASKAMMLQSTTFEPGFSALIRVLEKGRAMSLTLATPALFPPPEQRINPTSSPLTSNTKSQVQRFWQRSPCDSWFTNEPRGTVAFYRSLDEHRYKVHPQLQSAVGFEKARGLKVLEIGCGCGSEAELFARAGAHYTAVDLTNAAPTITQRRFQLANLEGRFVQGDAENLPFADGSFDLVYSHGVLHHTPDTPRTIREVHRVLTPGGRAVIMLYYRDSFNYHVNLRIVRRLRAHLLRTDLGIKLARMIFGETEQELRRHAELIREDRSSYVEIQNMLNRNTDGPDNPLSQVFSKASAQQMFWQFRNVKTEVMFWNPNWLPVIGKLLPHSIEERLASRWGWHLWIYAQKRHLEFTRPREHPRPEHFGVNHPSVLAEALAA
jgi:ubiquinone/menaquinone biosynthesis C-methylase UbiE